MQLLLKEKLVWEQQYIINFLIHFCHLSSTIGLILVEVTSAEFHFLATLKLIEKVFLNILMLNQYKCLLLMLHIVKMS